MLLSLPWNNTWKRTGRHLSVLPLTEPTVKEEDEGHGNQKNPQHQRNYSKKVSQDYCSTQKSTRIQNHLQMNITSNRSRICRCRWTLLGILCNELHPLWYGARIIHTARELKIKSLLFTIRINYRSLCWKNSLYSLFPRTQENFECN